MRTHVIISHVLEFVILPLLQSWVWTCVEGNKDSPVLLADMKQTGDLWRCTQRFFHSSFPWHCSLGERTLRCRWLFKVHTPEDVTTPPPGHTHPCLLFSPCFVPRQVWNRLGLLLHWRRCCGRHAAVHVAGLLLRQEAEALPLLKPGRREQAEERMDHGGLKGPKHQLLSQGGIAVLAGTMLI